MLLIFLGCAFTGLAQDATDSAAYQEDAPPVATDSVAPEMFGVTHTSQPDSVFHGGIQPNLEKYQQEQLNTRKFDTAKWKKIAANDFSEDELKADTTRADQKKKRTAKVMPPAGPLMKIAGYAVIGGVIVMLLYYLLKNMNWDIRTVDRTTKIIDPEAPLENIDDFQLAGPLKDAIAAGNYRVAIRLYYLDLLKKLNASGKIVWVKDKTNRDYLGELFAKSWNFEEVRKITLAYEQVWYGEHTLNADGFRILQYSFEDIDRQITTP